MAVFPRKRAGERGGAAETDAGGDGFDASACRQFAAPERQTPGGQVGTWGLADDGLELRHETAAREPDHLGEVLIRTPDKVKGKLAKILQGADPPKSEAAVADLLADAGFDPPLRFFSSLFWGVWMTRRRL